MGLTLSSPLPCSDMGEQDSRPTLALNLVCGFQNHHFNSYESQILHLLSWKKQNNREKSIYSSL